MLTRDQTPLTSPSRPRALAQRALVIGALVAAPLGSGAFAQTTKQAQPGFNLFSVQQDVEIGQQSAIEAEKQLSLLNDRGVNAYLTRVIQRLAAVAPGAKYPYTIKAVNSSEINAFSLPGGPMYVNTGLLAAARSEAELAGVLAHEMAHVALRHGTHQASNAYLAQAGFSILGGLFGRSSSASQVLNTIGGVGLNVAFLKFSRTYEYQADATGAQMMASAGYNPSAMADFFEVLRQQQGRDPSKLETFLSDHPSSADRENRIRQLASNLTTARMTEVGGFTQVKARVGGSSVASNYPVQRSVSGGTIYTPSSPISVNVAAPSSRFVTFSQPTGFFRIRLPDNWQSTTSGLASSFAPSGGVVDRGNGVPDMVAGMIVNHYAPFEDQSDRWDASLQHHYAPFEDRSQPRGGLEDATDDLVRRVLSVNSYLRATDNSAQPEVIDQAQGYSVLLTGQSPVTGEDERVTVYTRSLSDQHVLYALCVTPASIANTMERTCDRMVRTLTVNDAAAHRATTGSNNLRSGFRPPY